MTSDPTTAPPSPSPSRRLWELIEPIHAVTYFSAACQDAMTEVGMKGFWMGYFAARSAPFGAAAPALVEATFYNFSPTLVRRALPDAWARATPADVLTARSAAAAIALRQLAPEADEYARRALPLLESAAGAARCDGRPLAAANQALAAAADPVERLWQATTTLREHRGDGHVAALVAADLSGLEAHVLLSATVVGAATPERLQQARGWTPDQWDVAVDALRSRGLLDDGGAATAEGHLLRVGVEASTDDIAWQPYRDGLTDTGLDLLRTVLRPLATVVRQSGLIPFPNPIGLPDPHGDGSR